MVGRRRRANRPLGRNQSDVLHLLGKHGGHWWQGCGWQWGSPSNTTQILDSLVQRVARKQGAAPLWVRLEEKPAESRVLSHYRCDACGVDWSDRWICACNDHCPSCNREIQPHASEDGWTMRRLRLRDEQVGVLETMRANNQGRWSMDCNWVHGCNTMTIAILERLVAHGLVERTQEGPDPRLREWSLTQAGWDLDTEPYKHERVCFNLPKDLMQRIRHAAWVEECTEKEIVIEVLSDWAGL
jgi:hypothetical protein